MQSKKTTWNEFISNHWDSLAPSDFFTLEVWTPVFRPRNGVSGNLTLALRWRYAGLTLNLQTLCSWKDSIMKYRLFGILICLVLLFSTACQSVSDPAGSEPDNSTTVDDDTTTGGDDSTIADDDNTSPVGEDGEPLLTQKQADTIAPVTRAAAVIGKAVAAIVPIQDLQDVLFATQAYRHAHNLTPHWTPTPSS